jgi:hypothetical protein
MQYEYTISEDHLFLENVLKRNNLRGKETENAHGLNPSAKLSVRQTFKNAHIYEGKTAALMSTG